MQGPGCSGFRAADAGALLSDRQKAGGSGRKGAYVALLSIQNPGSRKIAGLLFRAGD
jgi:hypothetical protein